MKALVLEEYNKLVFKDMPVPEVGAKEVLVRVKACSICGSDVHGMDGSTGRRNPPLIMGHEAAGIIVEKGAEVAGYAEGDRVTFDSTIYCGECPYCRMGQINLCDDRRVLGVAPKEYHRDGAFAEYVAVPAHILYRLPDELSFEQAAMVEPVSIAFHAVNLTPVSLNDSAVVIGAGMIGLFVVQALRTAGCGKIISVDIDKNRLDLSLKLGADHALHAGEVDVPEEVRKLNNTQGASLAVEAVGNTSTVKTAVSALKKGGALTIIGNLAPTVEFPLQDVVTRQIRIQGSCASCGEFPACLDMIARGSINVDALISVVAPLADGADFFKRLYNQEPDLLKVILTP